MDGEVRYALNGDVHLAYKVVGDGPVTVMFVPIWFSNLDLFDIIEPVRRGIDALAADARVILWDRRGSGISDRLPGPATLEEGMDDLITVLDAVGAEKVALFGFNEAAALCALTAASRPDRVSHLILYGAFASAVWHPDYPWGQTMEERQIQVDWITQNWGSREAAQLMIWDDDESLIAWAQRYARNAVTPDALPAFYEMGAKTDVRHVLPSIRVPTLVLHRRDDPSVPVENGRYIGEQIPNARYVELEGNIHLPFLGNFDDVRDEMEEFLTGQRRRRETDRLLATILFTDICDSTAKAGALGDRRWKELLDEHDALARREIDFGNGRLIKSTGDGLLATFDGPQRAIRCAERLRNGFLRLGLETRVGLHTGEVEVRGDDVGGIAVHIAARVLQKAEAGQVLVSAAVPPLVAGSGITFESRGLHELKGVEGKWEVFEVAH